MQKGKHLFLFYFGGSTYCTIEVFVREWSHWSMFLLGGLVFVVVGSMNQLWGWETGLIKQIAAGVAVTLARGVCDRLHCQSVVGLGYLGLQRSARKHSGTGVSSVRPAVDPVGAAGHSPGRCDPVAILWGRMSEILHFRAQNQTVKEEHE